jgi:hypothetical protein
MGNVPALLETMVAERRRFASRSRESALTSPDETVEVTLAWLRRPAKNKPVVGTSIDLVCHGTYVLRRALWHREDYPQRLGAVK